MIELVEMEVDDLLSDMNYKNVPIVKGSALCALEEKNESIGKF